MDTKLKNLLSKEEEGKKKKISKALFQGQSIWMKVRDAALALKAMALSEGWKLPLESNLVLQMTLQKRQYQGHNYMIKWLRMLSE
jgi:hypothetical protein